MNKMKSVVCLLVLLLMSMGMQADNIVHLSSVSGAPGTTVTVSVTMDNSDVVSALQVKMPMPANCQLVDGSAVAGSRAAGHSVTAGVKDDTLNLIVYSTTMAPISGQQGEVMTFRLQLGSEPSVESLNPTTVIAVNDNGYRLPVSATQGEVKVSAAKAELSTRTIDFSRVPIRGTYKQDVTVSNTGNEPLIISGLTFSAPTLSCDAALPLTVEAGSSTALTVSYAPVTRGPLKETMRITSNSATTVSIVNITAEAYAVNELHIGNAEGYADSIVTIHLSMNNMDAINGFQVEFNLPSQLEYIEGSFALSDRKADHKVVANLSGSTLKAVCYSPTNAAFKGNDGDIATFRVRLAGQYGTTIEATTAILSAEVDGKVQNVLSGRSAGNISIMAPSIYTDYSWQTFDMGSTSITTKAAKALTIQNNGSAPLTISRIQFSEEDFAVDAPLPIKLDPWQSKAINVIYNGTATGDYAAIMQLYSNDPGQRLYQIHISGHRYSPNFLSSSAPAVAPGDTTAVVFGLDNNDAISGIQFDLNYDPSLFTIVDKTENGERAKNMTVTHRTLASGTERYFCYFLDDTSIAKGSGEIFKIYLRPDTAVSNGTYPVMISNIKLGTNGLKDMNAGSDYSTDIHVERPVVIRAVNVTREYGDDNPEFTFISEGNTVNGTPEITCEATKNSPVGTYPIVIKKGSVTNYNDTYINGTLTITKAPLTASAGTYTRKQGKANPAFEVSYSGFKNGENESVLQTKATASTEAVESSPVGEYPVVVSGASAENYDINYVNGKLIVTEADLTTIVAKSYTRVYGESNPAFDYTVDGEALVGEPQISCEATATSPVGTYPIVVRQGTVGNYNTKYVNGTLTITKAPLTITANNYTRKQGEENPVFTVSYKGFKNDETASSALSKQPMIATEATPASKPGNYAIIVSGAEANNYAITYVNGILTVTDADAVTVIANSFSREYGEDNPAFSYSVTGAALTGTPEITCEATKNSPVGTYPIVIKKGSVTNYNDTYINGTLTITKAPLTASAGTYTRKQGKANPAFEVSYSGFKNGENESVLQTKATASTEAVESSPVGEYPVVVSGASAENYDINYVNGKLIVTEADLTTIVAKSYTRVYGESNPAFDYTVDGEALVGEPQISCEATATSPVGTYPIVVRQGTVGNYNTKYVNGTLTITKAPLTITVQNEEIFVGQKLPDFKVTYSGFKNDETDEVLTSHAKATAQVNNTLTAGVYAVTVAGAEAQNYEMKYINGQLTIKDITDQKRELRADYDKLVVKVDSANNVISRNESLTTALIAVYSSNIEHLDSLDTKYERCVNMLSIIKTDDRTKSELADSISEIKAAMTGIKADNETVKQSIDANQPDKSSLAVLNDTVTVIGGSLNALSLYTEIEPMRQRIDDAATAADALLANGNVSLENQRNNEMLIKQYQDSIQELIDRLNRVESTLESIITAIGDPVILDRSHGRIYDLKGMLMRDGKLQRGVYIVNGRKIVVK